MKAYRSLYYIVIIFFLAGYASAADGGLLAAEVTYYQKGQGVKGYLARPDDNQKHPALILIHDWWGLKDSFRQFAENFARLGYVALAVDLYDGKSAATRE
jgi:dienelactone hydrolase